MGREEKEKERGKGKGEGIEERDEGRQPWGALQLLPPVCRMSLPWREWAEWEDVYHCLFVPEGGAERARGLERVATWRSRGRLPLAVEMTATLVELETLSTLSEHCLSLTYSMVLTRLVNGVVDPMQQRARATSVQKLAAEVQLPASLVAIRHEATHNRLPSLPMLRLAAEQAMVWLHEHYWHPQHELYRSLPGCVEESLRKCQMAVDKKISSRVPRWRVSSCASQLVRKLEPSQARTVLLPILLDAGYLAPPLQGPSRSAPTVPGDREQRVASLRLWLRLLGRLQELWPHEHIGGLLLVECARRLVAEPNDEPTPAAPADAPAAAVPTSRRDLLHACAAFALAQPQPKRGRRSVLRLGRAHLLQMASLISAAPDGGGAGVSSLLKRAVGRPEWPTCLADSARELLIIRREAEALRFSMRRQRGAVSKRRLPWCTTGGMLPTAYTVVRVSSEPGSVWGMCDEWPQAPIGEPVLAHWSDDGVAPAAGECIMGREDEAFAKDTLGDVSCNELAQLGSGAHDLNGHHGLTAQLGSYEEHDCTDAPLDSQCTVAPALMPFEVEILATRDEMAGAQFAH